MKNNKPKLSIDPDGTKHWRLNGLLHREDGPAVISSDGIKVWWLNGKLHRIDGPAFITKYGTKKWYLNGKPYTYDEWFKLLTPEQQFNSLWNLDDE